VPPDPGAADEGGQVVVQGTPEMIANNPNSITGRFLAEILCEDRRNCGMGGWPTFRWVIA